MKIIIVEGADNIGKDSLIHKLLEKINNIVTYIHCGKPEGKNNKDFAKYQDDYFNNIANKIINNEFSSDIVLFNRSWYGEFVYGTLYRNRSKLTVLRMINNIEKSLLKTINQDDIYYIQLFCDSGELLKNNDDQKSLSDGDIEKIIKENKLFKEVFNESILKHKLLLKINNGDKFKDMTSLHNKVFDFIYDLPWQIDD